MKPGALIAITTGDFASLNARVRRTKWRLMHPPSHAHYFSIASMTTMLDRFGFDTVYARDRRLLPQLAQHGLWSIRTEARRYARAPCPEPLGSRRPPSYT